MKALITGIGGQDGSYLADILLEQGYEVHGTYRHSSFDNLCRIKHCRNSLVLHECDATDPVSTAKLLRDVDPDEIYHEADQDHVGSSFRNPSLTIDVTVKAVSTLLDLVHPGVRVFLPCSATIFGNAQPPQDELTPLYPLSPYACAKAAILHLANYHRTVRNLYVSTGILYNHDSPRRGRNYLLQTLARKAFDVALGRASVVMIGDPDAVVDVGYARDYMEAAHQLLQLLEPGDYVIASGQTETVGHMAQVALAICGVKAKIIQDPTFKRPDLRGGQLIGDFTKLKEATGWKPKHDWRDVLGMIINRIREDHKWPVL